MIDGDFKGEKKHDPTVFTRSGADDDATAKKTHLEKGEEEGVTD